MFLLFNILNQAKLLNAEEDPELKSLLDDDDNLEDSPTNSDETIEAETEEEEEDQEEFDPKLYGQQMQMMFSAAIDSLSDSCKLQLQESKEKDDKHLFSEPCQKELSEALEAIQFPKFDLDEKIERKPFVNRQKIDEENFETAKYIIAVLVIMFIAVGMKVCISLSSVFASVAYIQGGFADLNAASAIALSSSIFSVIGAAAATNINGKTLSKLLGGVMLLFIPIILSRTKSEGSQPDLEEFNRFKKSLIKLKHEGFGMKEVKIYLIDNMNYLVIGSVTGLASGMLGIGGGLVMTTLLSVFDEKNTKTQHNAIGTSLVAMVPTGLAGTLTNAVNKTVIYKTGFLLATSSSIGMYLTARFITPEVNDANLKYLFSVFLALSAVKMIR
eukprot:augustus_masked-scaffold_22-processed-gene-0.4-mRNA-1 protein AED:1.00 eAED:1.00 QI:0/0/0/0/1/1/2/0/385